MNQEKHTNRSDGRADDELRPVELTLDPAPACLASVLIAMGNTRVICAVSLEPGQPRWMSGDDARGWITAEYRMLPFSTVPRARRETGKVGGRTQEIQRLIGRSLRAAVDLERLGPRTLWIDCDVLQADGGTRTASITGAFIALRIAVERLIEKGEMTENPIRERVAAISVGIVDGRPMLDLPYVEDAAAETDMNVVMTESGRFIEIQGTAEEAPYSRAELDSLLAMAEKGVNELIAKGSRV